MIDMPKLTCLKSKCSRIQYDLNKNLENENIIRIFELKPGHNKIKWKVMKPSDLRRVLSGEETSESIIERLSRVDDKELRHMGKQDYLELGKKELTHIGKQDFQQES